jgi:hypothetical protein
MGWHKGQFVQAANVPAHDIQLRAAETLLELHNAYPGRGNRQQGDDGDTGTRGPTFNLGVADSGKAKAIMNRVAHIQGSATSLHWARKWTPTKDSTTVNLPCLVKVGQGNNGYKTIEEFLPEYEIRCWPCSQRTRGTLSRTPTMRFWRDRLCRLQTLPRMAPKIKENQTAERKRLIPGIPGLSIPGDTRAFD